MSDSRSVFCALVGKPNVGKSSLMNRMLGHKLAIVTKKPQTTRTQIRGILTKGDVQYVFTDTPGAHAPATKLGDRMVNFGRKAITDADVAVMVFDPFARLTRPEEELIRALKAGNLPALAVINKSDRLESGDGAEKVKRQIENSGVFEQIMFTSAVTGDGVDALLEEIARHSVEGPHYFDDDSLTDVPEKAIAAEIVREKILLFMRDEIPHGVNVETEYFKEKKGGSLVDMGILIYCEKPSHKGMIIGKQGAMLKKIASRARVDIEQFLGVRVNMQCWVKVKENWRNSDFLLNDFGFKEE